MTATLRTGGGGTPLLSCPEQSGSEHGEQSALCEGGDRQTPGQLIDLHYVNYGCDVERGMKNGSHCCAECTLISFLLTLNAA